MKNSSKILIGFTSGIVIGGVLAILFAPDKGTETRKNISDAKSKLADAVKETISKGQQMFSEMKEKVKEKVEELN
jgi:gas vesicle protein